MLFSRLLPFVALLAAAVEAKKKTSQTRYYSIKNSLPDAFMGKHDWNIEGPAFHAFPEGAGCPGVTLPVYQMYNKKSEQTYFTTDPNGPQVLIASDNNWQHVGQPFTVFAAAQPDTAPLARLYSGKGWYLSASPQETAALQAQGYTLEGIIGHVPAPNWEGNIVVYRYLDD
jgi:hypothetical protein